MSAGRNDTGIIVERAGPVLRITLDRPEHRNALSSAAMHAMIDAIAHAESSEDRARVVRIAATGPDFCAGGDLSEGAAMTSEADTIDVVTKEMERSVQRLVGALWDLDVPIVVGLRGRAIGLGAALVLASDLVVAGDSARLRFPFAQRGFSPDSGVSWLLPRAVGVARAKRAMLLGDEIDARAALDAGLVADVVDDRRVDAVADEWVHRLARGATVALGQTKQLVHDGLDRTLAESLDAEVDAMGRCMTTRDFREGFDAFLERRDAEYEGR